MSVPVIDSIKSDTFSYTSTYHFGQLMRGSFEWGFFYKEMLVPQREHDRHILKSEPYW